VSEAGRSATWTAVWRGGYATDVSGRGHTLRSDEPRSAGGEDTGPMPTELLTAAVASCFCMAVAWAAGKRRVELPDLEVEVQARRAGTEPRYGRYEVWVRSSLPTDQLEPLVDLASRWCWVSNTLAAPPEIVHHVEGGG
jgi:putative redox protein